MRTMYSVHPIYKQCTIITLHTFHDYLLEFPHVLFVMYFLQVHVCCLRCFFSCNIIAYLNLWQIYMYNETRMHEILQHVPGLYCIRQFLIPLLYIIVDKR